MFLGLGNEHGMLPTEVATPAVKLASGSVPEHTVLMESVEQARQTKLYDDLVRTIACIFSSAELVSTCFFPKTPSNVAGMDLSLLESFYDAIARLGSLEVKSALMESSSSLIFVLFRSLKDGTWSLASLRSVIIMLENRFFMEPENYTLLAELWRLILEAPEDFKSALSFAIQSYNKDQLERLVAMVQQFITIQLYTAEIVDQKVASGVEVLGFIWSANEISQRISYRAFYNDAINSEDFNIKEDFYRWVEPERFSFCNYPFIYDTASKSRILQIDSTFQMREKFDDAIIRTIFFGMTCPYLVLSVRRQSLVRDTIVQIQEKVDDLKKPLKVEFVGEEGIDEGGLQKEFFQLLVRELFNQEYGMFRYHDEGRCFWFSSSADLSLDEEFELVGTLLGLAIYNGHILELHFPNVVYKKLLGRALTLEDLGQVHPQLAKGLEQLLSFEGDVEEVYSRNFQISVQDMFGDVVTVDLKEGGEHIHLTSENRDEYVRLCVQYYLDKSIARPFDSFKQGFLRLCKLSLLTLFRSDELEQLICGSPVIDFEALEKVAQYDGGYTKESQTVGHFWQVVHAFSEDEKRKLLAFTTGSDRAPIKGLASLQFVIARHGPDSSRLPVAHTCFNHLLLPEYSSKDKLRERLLTAINNAEGFGLM